MGRRREQTATPKLLTRLLSLVVCCSGFLASPESESFGRGFESLARYQNQNQGRPAKSDGLRFSLCEHSTSEILTVLQRVEGRGALESADRILQNLVRSFGMRLLLDAYPRTPPPHSRGADSDKTKTSRGNHQAAPDQGAGRAQRDGAGMGARQGAVPGICGWRLGQGSRPSPEPLLP